MRRLPLAMVLTLLLTSQSLAQGSPPMERWATEPVPELPGWATPLTASIWLPVIRADGRVLYGAATGTHAAMLAADREGPHTFVLLSGFVRLEEERQLDPSRAVAVSAKSTLVPTGRTLGEFQSERHVIPAEDGRGLVSYLLSFPALDPAWSVLDVEIPWLDSEQEPLRVTFFRVRERLQQVERHLAAWIEFTQQPDVSLRSAIVPYLACDAYERFMAHGEAFTVPYLLRELARQTPAHQEGVLPRFLIFHVLSQTDWGRTQQVPAAGDGKAAKRLLRRWRRANSPSLETVDPQAETGGR